MFMDSSSFNELLQLFSQSNTQKMHLVDVSGSIEEVQCVPLNLSQLKEIFSCINDPTPSNSQFNRTIIRLMESNITTAVGRPWTLLDKLCFTLQTRINSISSAANYSYKNEPLTVDIKKMCEDAVSKLQQNSKLFKNQTVSDGVITIEYGVPLLSVEKQMFEEIYTEEYFQKPEETLATNLISNEICSCVHTLTINNKKIDLSELTFEQRTNLIEVLPVSLTSPLLNYIKEVKAVFEDCTKFEGVSVPLDPTFFLLD